MKFFFALNMFIHEGYVESETGRSLYTYWNHELGGGTGGHKMTELGDGTRAHNVLERCCHVGGRMAIEVLCHHLVPSWGVMWLTCRGCPYCGCPLVLLGRLGVGERVND